MTPAPDGTWVGSPTIARQVGCSTAAVQNVLREAGIKTRSPRESHSRGKRCKPVKNLPQGDPPACKCGCGQPTEWSQRANRWNVYVTGHYRAPRDYHSAEWLQREYVDKRRSVANIAAEFGVSSSSVLKAMNRAGIARRDSSDSKRGVFSGARNPAWRGGVTPERQRLYKTAEWKALVTSVIRRDGGRCRRCGQGKRTTLHTHHVVPWSRDPAQRMNADNLVTLCPSCHAWVHSRENVNGDFLAYA